ncbi:cytochrome P450 [Streptomyces sp. NPDC058691]|uniref:cytochrome P450 n=1 Tax=Streptomyces sp. NPDC058691 TaxID=3346601 RepID=UPI0036492899
MTNETILKRINDFANRADPYPLYAELRRTPVARQEDGAYLVSTYREIKGLLHDPRISSDLSHRLPGDPQAAQAEGQPPSFIRMDPPDHDRVRRQAMRPFGPPHTPDRIARLHDEIARVTEGLLNSLEGRSRIDVVEDFAYPLPVSVICRLLGVPREDEHRFRAWADRIVSSTGVRTRGSTFSEDDEQARKEAITEMGVYMAGLLEERRASPTEDLMSGLVHDDGPDGQMAPMELIGSMVLLFIAGHETTVNLITNGMLTLLRYPEALERLRREPELMPSAVEELLRFEPPVHMLPQRTPLTDIEIAGVTVPKGSPLILVLAAGNRDPGRFADPDHFDPARADNQHFGFGSGIHSCFGAPLARLETQIALTAMIRRLDNPRLAEDPPPYRPSPVLRGPRHLRIECDGVRA